MNEPARTARIFIVGCPRSGTTLLQSMLAAHPEIFSLPETHFFPTIWPTYRSLASLGLTDKYSAGKQKLVQLGAQSGEIPNWLSGYFIGRLTDSFIKILDRKASTEGKKAWVEKTPMHLHFVPHIEKLVPDVKFIHIIRSGRDTIASLYEATNKYPESWGGARSMEKCLHRWVKDLAISLTYTEAKNHFILRYEELISHTAEQLQLISTFLGIEHSPEMLTGYASSFGKIRERDAEWTYGAGQKLYNSSRAKYDNLFSDIEKETISLETTKAGLEKYL